MSALIWRGGLMGELDKRDHQILEELQKNGRIKITELANKVGLSATPCQIRMKRLEDCGYIMGYTALVDHGKLDYSHVAFVQITLSKNHAKALKEFNLAVMGIAEIEQCHMVAASFDYLLKVRTTDIKSYRKILGDKISMLPHVQQSSSFVSMENVKDPGL
jgi:Lrp/AsnC family leucine-responsive transcriptional regulator